MTVLRVLQSKAHHSEAVFPWCKVALLATMPQRHRAATQGCIFSRCPLSMQTPSWTGWHTCKKWKATCRQAGTQQPALSQYGSPFRCLRGQSTAEQVHHSRGHPVSLQLPALRRGQWVHATHELSGLLSTTAFCACRGKGTTQSFRGRPGRWSTLQALCTSLPFCTGSQGAARLLLGRPCLL